VVISRGQTAQTLASAGQVKPVKKVEEQHQVDNDHQILSNLDRIMQNLEE
jgi:hypothetical protein